MLLAATSRKVSLQSTRKSARIAPLAFIHARGHRIQSASTSGTSLLRAETRQEWPERRGEPSSLGRATVGGRVQFHASARREGMPMVALLASLLKASVSLEYARTAARIALTFVPMVLVKKHVMRKMLRHVVTDTPEMEAKRAIMFLKIRRHTIFYRILIAIPVVLFSLTLIASLERTPLTGRWRLILLSPDEEDAIAAQLAGTGWYNAIGDILAQEGEPVKIVPPTDWRYQWVLSTLRQLESVIPILSVEKYANTPWLECGPDDIPLPPPAKYPLRPRPSGKDYIRWFCDAYCSRPAHPSPHKIPGPPYSLIVVDRPNCDNAFSFGFGPDGGGGIVVYSGFLDKILAEVAPDPEEQSSAANDFSPPVRSGILSSVLGTIFPVSRQSAPSAPTPTPEQTSQLAILLAHELAHLILSHHLETLSSGEVVVPGALSFFSDLLRTLLFPITMAFGPFVNDAVANLGTVGQGNVRQLTEYCTSVAQEFEADAVSTRLLAHAGYDARKTIDFWEQRRDLAQSECTPIRSEEETHRKLSLVMRIMGETHPLNEERVTRLKGELARWDRERKKALKKIEDEMAYGLEGLKRARMRHSMRTSSDIVPKV